MKKEKLRLKKLNNKGSALVVVIIVIAFITVLAKGCKTPTNEIVTEVPEDLEEFVNTYNNIIYFYDLYSKKLYLR